MFIPWRWPVFSVLWCFVLLYHCLSFTHICLVLWASELLFYVPWCSVRCQPLTRLQSCPKQWSQRVMQHGQPCFKAMAGIPKAHNPMPFNKNDWVSVPPCLTWVVCKPFCRSDTTNHRFLKIPLEGQVSCVSSRKTTVVPDHDLPMK